MRRWLATRMDALVSTKPWKGVSRPRVFGVLLLGGFLVVGPSAQAQQPLTEVLFGNLSPSASEWPIYLAETGGFFKAEGLHVTVIAGGGPTNVINALATGAVNLADDGTDSYIAAVAHGLGIKMVAPVFQNMPYNLIVQPSVTSWSQLKGKSIVVGTKKDVTAICFYKMAETQHLKDSDFSMIVGGTSNARYAALISGNVQGAMLSQPFDLLAESKGMKPLASGADYFKNNWLFTAMAVNSKWASANRETAVKMIRAFRKGIAFGYTHRKEAVQALIDATHVDPAIAQAAYDVDFVKTKSFDPNMHLNFAAVQNIAHIMVEAGDISAAPANADLFDTSYLADSGK